MKDNKTLYICYFWLDEPLVQTQVLPYLREIQKDGTKISLLTFERENLSAEKIETERKKLADEGIDWYFLKYHKTPSVPATVFDILNGARYVRQLIKRENFDILHARVHIPALMGELARKSLLSGKKPKLLFDIRGFFPEEYTDAGTWKENGSIYKTVKKVEKILLRESDGFVVLTEKARHILFPESTKTGYDKYGRPVEVIPCCIDKNRYESAEILSREAIRSELGIKDKRVFIYVGSFGSWYLSEEITDFFAQAKIQTPNSFFIILTKNDHEKITQMLLKKGLENTNFLVKSVSPDEVPKYLKASDAAICFIKACYSKQSSSPTKIAEYLGGGLPIISNSGVGDLDELIEKNNVGIILQNLEKENYIRALENIDVLLQDKNLQNHCKKIAKEQFDLETVAGERYRRIYKNLLK